jgi:hypothetical protein
LLLAFRCPRVQDGINLLLLFQFTDEVTHLTTLLTLTDFRIDKNLIHPSLNTVIRAVVCKCTFLADKRMTNGIGLSRYAF